MGERASPTSPSTEPPASSNDGRNARLPRRLLAWECGARSPPPPGARVNVARAWSCFPPLATAPPRGSSSSQRFARLRRRPERSRIRLSSSSLPPRFCLVDRQRDPRRSGAGRRLNPGDLRRVHPSPGACRCCARSRRGAREGRGATVRRRGGGVRGGRPRRADDRAGVEVRRGGARHGGVLGVSAAGWRGLAAARLHNRARA